MTIFRSQTDEVLAAKWDPEPWQHADGIRRATAYDASGEWSRLAEFDPRVECVPSRDCDACGGSGTVSTDGSLTCPICDGNSYTERPAVNPILVAFRDYALRKQWTLQSSAEEWSLKIGIRDPLILASFNPEHIDHANKVLTRLAALK